MHSAIISSVCQTYKMSDVLDNPSKRIPLQYFDTNYVIMVGTVYTLCILGTVCIVDTVRNVGTVSTVRTVSWYYGYCGYFVIFDGQKTHHFSNYVIFH